MPPSNSRKYFKFESDSIKQIDASSHQDKSHLSNTHAQTLSLYQAGLTPVEIAEERGLKMTTVVSHLAQLIELEEDIRLEDVVSRKQISVILNVINQLGPASLSQLKETLGEGVSYDEIKLVRAKWLQEHS